MIGTLQQVIFSNNYLGIIVYKENRVDRKGNHEVFTNKQLVNTHCII